MSFSAPRQLVPNINTRICIYLPLRAQVSTKRLCTEGQQLTNVLNTASRSGGSRVAAMTLIASLVEKISCPGESDGDHVLRPTANGMLSGYRSYLIWTLSPVRRNVRLRVRIKCRLGRSSGDGACDESGGREGRTHNGNEWTLQTEAAVKMKYERVKQ